MPKKAKSKVFRPKARRRKDRGKHTTSETNSDTSDPGHCDQLEITCESGPDFGDVNQGKPNNASTGLSSSANVLPSHQEVSVHGDHDYWLHNPNVLLEQKQTDNTANDSCPSGGNDDHDYCLIYPDVLMKQKQVYNDSDESWFCDGITLQPQLEVAVQAESGKCSVENIEHLEALDFVQEITVHSVDLTPQAFDAAKCVLEESTSDTLIEEPVELPSVAFRDKCQESLVCSGAMQTKDINENYPSKIDVTFSPEKSLSCSGDVESLGSNDLSTSKTTNIKEVFEKCVSQLNVSLPAQWKAIQDGDGLSILKFSPCTVKIVQRTIQINENLKITASFHGNLLPESHGIYEEAKKFTFETDNPVDLSSNLCKLVGRYRLFEVCGGIPSIKYRSLWHKDDSVYVDVNPFKDTRYTTTCRSKQCTIALPQIQRQCEECMKVNKKFAKRSVYRHPVISPSGRFRTPKSKKPNKYLSSAEKDARLKRFVKNIRNVKEVNERLKEKVAELQRMLKEEGVNLDPNLSDELTHALEEADKSNKLNDFHKLFLQQQLKACQVKSATGMRWHPLIIRFALQLKMTSSVAYSVMAQSGFMKLPGVRTLYDYTSAISVEEGIHYEIIEDVAKVVEGFKHEYQRNHILAFDEVAICQGLVQKKSTGEVVGYSNLDKVQEEMVNMEKRVKDLAEEVTPKPPKAPPLVKSMLSYMVKGTASHVQSVVASFGVSKLTKENLHDYTWKVVECLEMSGVQVTVMVCDGSPINRGFISMQPAHSTDSKVVYDTVNPFSPTRLIYFMSDPPHLLKTIRNCLYNSGRKRCRAMEKNGQKMSWKTIIALYKLKSEQTIKKLFKLTAPCVFLNSYSFMKVAYAARVISNSVALALSDLKWPDTSELCIFEKF